MVSGIVLQLNKLSTFRINFGPAYPIEQKSYWKDRCKTIRDTVAYRDYRTSYKEELIEESLYSRFITDEDRSRKEIYIFYNFYHWYSNNNVLLCCTAAFYFYDPAIIGWYILLFYVLKSLFCNRYWPFSDL